MANGDQLFKDIEDVLSVSASFPLFQSTVDACVAFIAFIRCFVVKVVVVVIDAIKVTESDSSIAGGN